MGVTKKPIKITLPAITEVAKTAPKKRGRPPGSKGKTKSLSSKDWVPAPVDWEKLSKRLQEALAAQIKETDAYKKLWEEFEEKIVISETVPIWRRIKFVFTGKI